jgi:hypothetical protein
MSAVVIAAVSFEELTNAVARGDPFQFTMAPGTNPVPVTVRVNPAPPGTIAEGTIGFRKGTGLLLATSLLGIARAARVKQIHKTFDAVNRLIGTPLRDLRDNYTRLVERFKPSTNTQLWRVHA